MARKSTKTAAAGKATKLAVAAAAATSQAKAQAAELGDRLAPRVDDARDRLVDLTGTVATRIDDLTDTVSTRLDELGGTVATRVDELTGTVATRLDDALPDRVTPAVVKQRVPATARPSRFRQALLVLGLGALAAVLTRRLTSGGSQQTWRSAGDQATPAGGSAHGLVAGNDHAAGTAPGAAADEAGEVDLTTTGMTGTAGPVRTTVDPAGGSPEEVAADATDTPHPVTTPDQPAQKVILD